MMNDHDQYWAGDEAERQRLLKRHYDQRQATDPYATSRDGNQRELEITAIRQELRKIAPGHLIDLGCGNGYTLISLADELVDWRLEGIDLSDVLVEGAHRLLEQRRDKVASVPTFHCGDAIRFVRQLAAGSIDVVVTERFLLNLPSPDMQRAVLKDIYLALRPGAHLLMCEASRDGFAELNRLRAKMGLSVTPETSADNLSAIRFDDAEIEAYIDGIGFDLIAKHGFSTFFAISRVLHPALVAPEQPTFDAKMNTLARQIQEAMPFTPGVGSNVLWVLKKRV